MKLFRSLSAVLFTVMSLTSLSLASDKQPYLRVAELEIDPAQIDAFNKAIKEGIEAAVSLEPGVLMLFAVAEKENPNRIRVFEAYTDEPAYQKHLQEPHFRKFRDLTDGMVKSRKLVDAVPIVLDAKSAFPR